MTNGLPGVRKLLRSRGRTHLASPLLLWGSHCLSISLSLSLLPVPCVSFPRKGTLYTLRSSSAFLRLPSLNCRVKNREHTSQRTRRRLTLIFNINEMVLHFTSACCSVSFPRASQSPGGKGFLILAAETSFQRQEQS